jgi:hypothetical protein
LISLPFRSSPASAFKIRALILRAFGINIAQAQTSL